MKVKDAHIGILGSGNVAFHLAKALQQNLAKQSIFINSRNKIAAQNLAANFQVCWIEDFNEFVEKCDIVIIAVADDAIEQLAIDFKIKDKIVAHTSGVVSMHKLKNTGQNYGSFYPLQTFTKNRAVDFKKVPLLIDASNESTKQILLALAHQLSDKVKEVKDEERALIHPAAVMVNNFTNHLFTLAIDYMENKNLDFEILHALIEETAQKAIEQNPKEIQTGPAKRRDEKTIQQHIEMLEDPKLKELYLWFTQSIEKYYE